MSMTSQSTPNHNVKVILSLSRLSWKVRVVLSALLITGLAVYFACGPSLSLWHVMLLGLLSSAVVYFFRHQRRGFGPVFYYDLVRTARRPRLIIHRVVYVSLALAAIFSVYTSWFPGAFVFDDPFRSDTLPRSQAPKFAFSLFQTYFWLQQLMLLLIVPVYTAATITEENEHRTLEYLLTTDLQDHEIILGILCGRLANIFLFILAGLPVLSVLQFLGGVDPRAVWTSLAIGLITSIQIGALSILVSVCSATTAQAVLNTYFALFFFLLLTAFVFPMNIVFATISVLQYVDGALPKSQSLPELLFFFAFFTALLTWFLLGLAVTHLRLHALSNAQPNTNSDDAWKAAWQQTLKPFGRMSNNFNAFTDEVPAPAADDELTTAPRHSFEETKSKGFLVATRRSSLARRVPVGENALLWKELGMNVEYLFRPDYTTWVALFAVVMFCGAARWLTADMFEHRSPDWFEFNGMHIWFILGACFVFLFVALNAAGRVTYERQQQTLDALLTLPVEIVDILRAKALGSIVLLSLPLIGLLFYSCVMFTSGIFRLATVLCLIELSTVYLLFFATLGLWFSVFQRSTLRATLFTLLSILLVLAGPTVAWKFVYYSPMRSSIHHMPSWEYLSLIAFTPPMTMWTVASATSTSRWLTERREFVEFVAALVGGHTYLLFSLLLWRSMLRYFQNQKGKIAVSTQWKTEKSSLATSED